MNTIAFMSFMNEKFHRLSDMTCIDKDVLTHYAKVYLYTSILHRRDFVLYKVPQKSESQRAVFNETEFIKVWFFQTQRGLETCEFKSTLIPQELTTTEEGAKKFIPAHTILCAMKPLGNDQVLDFFNIRKRKHTQYKIELVTTRCKEETQRKSMDKTCVKKHGRKKKPNHLSYKIHLNQQKIVIKILNITNHKKTPRKKSIPTI